MSEKKRDDFIRNLNIVGYTQESIKGILSAYDLLCEADEQMSYLYQNANDECLFKSIKTAGACTSRYEEDFRHIFGNVEEEIMVNGKKYVLKND